MQTCTPIICGGVPYDVLWKRGPDGAPHIIDIYFHGTEQLVPIWQANQRDYMDALLAAIAWRP
jgi:hypothetical protein